MRLSGYVLFLCLGLAAPVGLAAQDSARQQQKPEPKPKRSQDLISREEIEALPAEVLNAYEVVARLRRAWLNTRGSGTLTQEAVGGIVAYVNDMRRGDVGTLREVDRLQIAEIRRLRGSDATTRFGTGHENGAILVKLK